MKKKRFSVARTARFIQSLWAIGLSPEDVGAALGVFIDEGELTIKLVESALKRITK